MIALLLTTLFVVDLNFADGSSVVCATDQPVTIQPSERRLVVENCTRPDGEIFADGFEGGQP